MHVDNYKDIMEAERPKLPPGHPKMDVLNRAKIFAPFAALRGFEERIAAEESSRADVNEKAWEYSPDGDIYNIYDDA